MLHQGFKGVGRGSYGDAVMSSGDSSANKHTTQSSIPDPIKFTPDEIEKKMNGEVYFWPPKGNDFWPRNPHKGQLPSDLWTLNQGDEFLWMSGAKTGRNGGQSTKIEYFHGECRGWRKADREYPNGRIIVT